MRSLAIILPLVLAGGLVSAQETSRFAFDIGGGFTQRVRNTGRHLDTGWNIQAGAGYNFTSHVGAMIQFNYNMMDVNGATLTNIGVPGGDVKLWNFTLDPIVHLNPKGPMDVYLI